MDTKAAFEKWFKPKKIAMQSRGISTIRIVRLYRCQWEAWAASRAAIEIELPRGTSDEIGGYSIDLHTTENAITSHEIRIKGKTE